MKTFKDDRPCYGQDPFLFTHEGNTFLIESQDEERITISKWTGKDRHGTSIIWDKPDEHQVWAPEIHLVNGVWFILYSSSDGHNRNHRAKTIQSLLPFGPYSPGRTTGPDVWSIDATTFNYKLTQYVVWSGWKENGDEFPQHLYIAKWGSSDRQILASPRLDWEGQILEGPQWCPETQRIYYSANASWTQDYATGFLQLKTPDHDPLNPGAWTKHHEPLAVNKGHAQPLGNGKFIYHKKLSPFPGWTDRCIEIGSII